MRLRSWSSVVALSVVTLAVEGCCGRSSKCAEAPRPHEEPPPASPLGLPRGGPPPSSDLALVVTSEGVVALDELGQRAWVVAPTAEVSWCRVDPQGRVLWLRHGRDGTLSLVDLESDGPPVPVLEQTPDTVVIAYPSGPLAQPEPYELMEGLVVHMQERPRLEAILGCDGDLAYSCFDDVEDFEAVHAARLAELRITLETQPIQHPDVLTAVASRARGYRPPPDAMPQARPAPERVITVPREPCVEEPGDCGNATPLPGTPYWQVVVANDRGDFFHETRQLYDPATAEFFDPRDAKARAPKPLAESNETFVPQWVSPSGELALGYDVLVRLEGGTLASGFGPACGFWGGGWEVSDR